MEKFLIIIGIVTTLFTFGYYMLALMDMAPLTIATPLFILSIFFTIFIITNQQRFKGFKP